MSEPKVDQPEFLAGAPETRRFREVMLDIETTNLRGNMGRITVACVKPVGMETLILRMDNYDAPLWDDSLLVKDLRDTLAKCARVVTWFGARFDTKFIRTRSVLQNLHHDVVGFRHLDLYDTSRRELLMTSHKLKTLVNTFGAGQKPEPREETWRRAMFGDKRSLDEIANRCVEDVRQLECVYLQLEPYIQSWKWVTV